jgi:proline iminopeptidase
MLAFAVASLAVFSVTPVADLPRHGAVPRPEVELHFRTVGQGAPLVILSGGPGQDVRQLADVYDRLADFRTCILLDQRGTGRSVLSKLDPETVRLDLYVRDLEALRRHLKLEKLSLLGHSWGAMLALAYAVEHPEHTDQLVLIGTGPIALDYLQVAGDNLDHRRGMLHVRGELGEAQDLFELRPFFFDQKKAEAFANRDRTGEKAVAVSHLIFSDLMKRGFDLRPGARKLQGKTLILQGRQDLMPESFVLEMSAIIPNSKLVFVERSGHFPWIEQPEPFFAALLPFLKG